MALTAFASVLLLLAAAGDVVPPPGGVVPPGGAVVPPAAADSSPPSAPPSPAAENSDLAASSASDAASALRATQDLEAKLIEIRREMEGLEKQRAAWGDVRLGLDDLKARVEQLERQMDDMPRDAFFGAPSIKSSPTPFGPGRRFRSEGGFSSVHWGARLQAGYEGALVVRGPGQTVAHENDRSGFLLRHAELMLEGQVLYRRFEYRLLVDFAEPVILKDAFLQWRATSWLGVRVGRFKLPFGFQRYLRSTYYDFVDRSETMNAFSLERDVGAMIVARPLAGRLQFQLAVTNGALATETNGAGANLYPGGQSDYQANRFNDNLDLAYTARVVAAPWGPLPDSEGDLIGQSVPRVSFGVAGHYNLLPTDIALRTNNPAANVDVDGDGRVDNVSVWQGGAELRAHFHGAAVQAELFRRLEHPGAAAADRYSGGQYAQASYMVIAHVLEVAARIERTDLPLYGAPFAVRQTSGTRIDGQTAAVSAFFHGHDLKLQVDYSHLATARVAVPAGFYTQDSHRLRVSAQLIF
jgi:hypothetical protein